MKDKMPQNIISSDDAVIFSKELARKIGLNEAIIYKAISDKYFHRMDQKQIDNAGYFPYAVEEMEQDTTLTRKQQKIAIIHLKTLKLISCERKQLNGIRHFKLFWQLEL